MSNTGSSLSGVATRYAKALFELAGENKKLPSVEKDLDVLKQALADSSDLRELITSPVYSREQQSNAIGAIAKKMKLQPIMSNTLALLAQNRRLATLPNLIETVQIMIADSKGITTAEVVAAKALSVAQEKKLTGILKKIVGKDVIINLSVDKSLIGGLVVKVGSKMIDSSIRSKLNNLKTAMKEVG